MNNLAEFLGRKVKMKWSTGIGCYLIRQAIVIGYNTQITEDNDYELAIEFEGPDVNLGHNCIHSYFFLIRPIINNNGWFVKLSQIEFISQKPRIGKERYTTCSIKKE